MHDDVQGKPIARSEFLDKLQMRMLELQMKQDEQIRRWREESYRLEREYLDRSIAYSREMAELNWELSWEEFDREMEEAMKRVGGGMADAPGREPGA
jgi:hypothetical protein